MGVSDRLQARFTQLQTTSSDSHWRQRPPPGAAASPCRCHATDKTIVRTSDQYDKQNFNPGALGGLKGLVRWLISWLTDDQSATKLSNALRLWLLRAEALCPQSRSFYLRVSGFFLIVPKNIIRGHTGRPEVHLKNCKTLTLNEKNSRNMRKTQRQQMWTHQSCNQICSVTIWNYSGHKWNTKLCSCNDDLTWCLKQLKVINKWTNWSRPSWM